MTSQERLALNLGNLMLQNLSLADQLERATEALKSAQEALSKVNNVPNETLGEKGNG